MSEMCSEDLEISYDCTRYPLSESKDKDRRNELERALDLLPLTLTILL